MYQESPVLAASTCQAEFFRNCFSQAAPYGAVNLHMGCEPQGMTRHRGGSTLVHTCIGMSAGTALQDIFALFHLGKDFKFVSKKSIFFIPIVGWSMFLTGACTSVPCSLDGFTSASIATLSSRFLQSSRAR